MIKKQRQWKAIVSSDWNECLAPCGPFDFISFVYPELKSKTGILFKQYTGNMITLENAVGQVGGLLPKPITPEQMDAYIDKEFATYDGVCELIEWCLTQGILFMINTTGVIGYFQRLFIKNCIPEIPVLSAHPMVRFDEKPKGRMDILTLARISDKARNTQKVIDQYGIGNIGNIGDDSIIVMGDSGGDGPHFKWGRQQNAFLIGCKAKPSLEKYCEENGISIDLRFGIPEMPEAKETAGKKTDVDFHHLRYPIQEFLGI